MKKFLALLLACAMLIGCASALADDAITLTAILRLPAAFIVEDNPVIAAWGERTNTAFEIEAPPVSNYMDRLQVVMASGEAPDLIHIQNLDSNFQQWSRDELLLDLTPYFNAETMPNAFAALTSDDLASCYVDGKLYALPRVQAKPLDAIIYRGDWLEKLNLSVPTTPEQFAEVMKAFATMDPDGNGQNDTYGTSLRDLEDRNLIFGFGLKPTSVPGEDGTYSLMASTQAYEDYLTWLRDMYAAGSIDPEWYLSQSYEDQDKFYAGQIGAIYTATTLNHLNSFSNNETFKAANPDGYLVAGPSLSAMAEGVLDVYYPPQIWGAHAISTDSQNIEQAIKVLDDGYTAECATLLFAGVEGVTYTSLDPETRVLTATEEQTALRSNVYSSSYLSITYAMPDKSMVISGGTSATEEELARWLKANDEIAAVTRRVSYLGEGSLPGISDENTKLVNSGITSEFSEMRTKYICGQIDRDEFHSFIQDKYLPAYADYMTLVSESGINK